VKEKWAEKVIYALVVLLCSSCGGDLKNQFAWVGIEPATFWY